MSVRGRIKFDLKLTDRRFFLRRKHCARIVTQPRNQWFIRAVDEATWWRGECSDASESAKSLPKSWDERRKWFEPALGQTAASRRVFAGPAARRIFPRGAKWSPLIRATFIVETGRITRSCRCQVWVARSRNRDIPQPIGTPTPTRHSWEFKARRSSSRSTTTLSVRELTKRNPRARKKRKRTERYESLWSPSAMIDFGSRIARESSLIRRRFVDNFRKFGFRNWIRWWIVVLSFRDSGAPHKSDSSYVFASLTTAKYGTRESREWSRSYARVYNISNNIDSPSPTGSDRKIQNL